MKEFDTWEEYGEYFGYPECCIREFVTFSHMGDPNLSDRPLIGTGFVPCPVCAESKTAEQLVAEINRNRQHPVPFRSRP